MEITASPHRPAPTPWGRLLALVIVLAPVSVLVLLPIGLGLDRYVMSGDSMDGGDDGIAQGTVLFERAVPVSDLRVGDVITYPAPESSDVDGMVTHRVVDVRGAGVVTQGDAEPGRDPWMLRPRRAERVARGLHPALGRIRLPVRRRPGTWLLVVASAALLALLLSGEMKRRRLARPSVRNAGSSRESRDEE